MNQRIRLSVSVFRHLKSQRVKSVINSVNKRCFCSGLQTIHYNKIDIPKLDLSDEIDWENELPNIYGEKKSILSETQDDLSEFSKYLPETFNFAPYVNKSETLSNLVKLGVDLHKLEKKYGVLETICKLDFERDMKAHLTFLSDYVETSNLGYFLTKNPMIFKEPLDDLDTRINYLESKNFTMSMIQRIVSTNPYWLNYKTKSIDYRLGHFQKDFKLTGTDVRALATKQARLITYNIKHIEANTFALREEMGFDKSQLRHLLLTKPRLWMLHHLSLLGRFNYVHNTMKISHKLICAIPEVLLCREFRIKQRHTFLEKLGRAQYDNTLPNYVSLYTLVRGSDAEFCTNAAKCTVSDFNLYLKSL